MSARRHAALTVSTVKGLLKYYTLRTDLAGNFVDASWVRIPVVCIKNSYHWLLDGEELTEPNLHDSRTV